MPALIPGYEYDIFISYRHKDNKYDGWVTEFVSNLRKELGATFKEDISIYFDENSHDGLSETHHVDESLRRKLRSVILIPIISQTYCDPKSFAWTNELLPFTELASTDGVGMNVALRTGNVASRILPVRIHQLETADVHLYENVTGLKLRPVDFIYQHKGATRPLRSKDDELQHSNHHLLYRDQISKLALAIKEILSSVKEPAKTHINFQSKLQEPRRSSRVVTIATICFAMVLAVLYFVVLPDAGPDPNERPSVAVIPFRNNTGSPELDYYGLGMASEIRTKLSLSKQFDFISSLEAAVKYSNTIKTTQEIGNELGVKYIIAGIFQQSGNKLKIEAELIDAETGQVIWTVPFERESADIFVMQNEIARRVLQQFSSTHGDTVAQSTVNLVAYAHYAKASELLNHAFGDSADFVDSYKSVIDQYEKAIESDSNFVDAWADLIGVESYLYYNRPEDTLRKRKIESYYQYFNEHFPESWQKKLVAGHFTYRVKNDFERAIGLMEDVLDEHPENVHAIFALAALNYRKLDLENSVGYCLKQINVNPGHAGNWYFLSIVLSAAGDTKNSYNAALKAWRLSKSKLHAEPLIGLSFLNKTSPLPDDLRTEFADQIEYLEHVRSKNFRAAKRSAFRRKKYSELAEMCFELGEKDSALFYWSKQDQKELSKDSVDYFHYRGQPHNALAAFERLENPVFKSAFDNVNKESYLTRKVALYCMLGMFDGAALILSELQREFPQCNQYDFLAEYPPVALGRKTNKALNEQMEKMKARKKEIDLLKFQL